MANKQSGGGTRKHGRNKAKCEKYRRTVGKPNGPGQPGVKAGPRRNRTRLGLTK